MLKDFTNTSLGIRTSWSGTKRIPWHLISYNLKLEMGKRKKLHIDFDLMLEVSVYSLLI